MTSVASPLVAESTPIGARNDALRRLATSPRRKLLLVTHEWGGGVEKHVNDLTALLARECEVLVLKPLVDVDHGLSLAWANPGESLQAYFGATHYDRLLELLRALRIDRVHIHHVHDLPRAVLDLPKALGVPYDCTLHDYYPVCPQYQLVTPEGRYCGEPDERGCCACLAKRPARWGLDIVAWRTVFGEFLTRAQRVIVPSHDVERRIGRYFPSLRVQVWPHPEPSIVAPKIHRRPQLGTLKILLLGGFPPSKGLRVVEACALDAKARDLPLHFRLIGHTSAPIARAPEAPLSLSGQYHDADLRSLIELEHAQAFFFPSQVPETYSYTLSAAMQTGLPIFASDLGAFPERLAHYAAAHLLPWNAPAARWNDAFLAELRSGVVLQATHANAGSDAAG